MKETRTGKRCAPWTCWCPKSARSIGGSERENDHDKLLARLRAQKASRKRLLVVPETPQIRERAATQASAWASNGSFSLVTGMQNIRDVIPFDARAYGSAEF